MTGIVENETASPERCSECGSDAIHHRQRRGDWICDDCEFVWLKPVERSLETQEKSAVFISYGHSDAPAFARKLGQDLGEQGFPVWLDIDSLEVGSDWDVRIEAGIKASRVLLATITPTSVREDSICRDEIILAHSQGKVIVPLRVSTDPRAVPTLLLVRRNWLDFTGEYGTAFGRLVRFLEGDDRALEAPLASVVAGLVPLDFGPELARHSRGFVGRKWLDRELDGWLADSRRRAFIVVGEPGIGKSAIAAHFATTRSEIAAIHFCTTRNTRTLDPFEFVASVSAQLAGRVQGFADAFQARRPELPRNTASDAFRELILEPAASMDDATLVQVVVVDSLDEAATRAGETIADIVLTHAPDLPGWLRLIATTRPEAAILDRLRRLSAVELRADRVENLSDLDEYLRAGSPSPEAALRIAELASGNFLYARMAIESLSDNTLSIDDLTELSPGLGDYLLTVFSRVFSDAEVYAFRFAPLLRCLLAAQAPLPEEVLLRALHLDRERLNRELRPMRSLLRVDDHDQGRTFTLYHRSLVEWLSEPAESGSYFCDASAGHELLADALKGHVNTSEYAARYLPYHLERLNRWDDLANLIVEPGYLEAAFRIGPREIRIHAHSLEQHAEWRAGPAFLSAEVKFAYGGELLVRLGSMLRSMGDIPAAIEMLRKAEGVVQDEDGLAEVRVGISDMMHLQGQYQVAADDAEAVRREIAGTQGKQSQAYVDVVLRLAHYYKFLDLARARLELVSLDVASMDRAHEGTWLFALGGSVMSLTGEDQKGAELLHRAMLIAEAEQDQDLIARCCRRLADYEIAKEHPDFAVAESLIDKGLRVAEEVGSRHAQYFPTTRGELLRRFGKYDEAVRSYDLAFTLASRSGVPGWAAHALLGRAECARMAQDSETGRHLARARELYESINQAWGLLHSDIASVLGEGPDSPNWIRLIEIAERAERVGYAGLSRDLHEIHDERRRDWFHPLMFP